MELQHRFTVPASVDETWAAFQDLELVAPCFPGAALTSVDGDSFSGTVKIKLGPISMQYAGTGTFLERDEATHRARIEAKGKDKRGNGTAAALVTAQLSPEGSGTAVDVSTDLSITGKPAQFGRGVIQDVSNKLLERFTVCLADTLSGSEEAAEEPAVAAPAPVPTPSANAVADSDGDAPKAAPPPQRATAVPDAEREGPTEPASPTAGRGSRADDEGLDLFRTVAPVLARRYALPIGGSLLALYVLIRVLRR
jgi:carbon monoxide dehydrogenase subunit G